MAKLSRESIVEGIPYQGREGNKKDTEGKYLERRADGTGRHQGPFSAAAQPHPRHLRRQLGRRGRLLL